MSRGGRRILLTVGAIVACATVGLADARAAAGDSTTLEIVTVPRVSGMVFELDGKRFSSRGDGVARIEYSGSTSLEDRLVGVDSKTKRGARLSFARWYGDPTRPRVKTLTAALNIYYPVRFTFSNLSGGVIEPGVLSSLRLRSSNGVVETFYNDALYRTQFLQGTRVVSTPDGPVAKDVIFSVQRAIVNGTNVVNRSQQRFYPRKQPKMDVALLFYSAKFVARDALLGFPIGSGVKLRHPDGRTQFYPFENNAEIVIEALPRGEYWVEVDGPGTSFLRPVSLSRNQEVSLEVLSYLDIGLALGILASIALGLLYVGRPHLFSVREFFFGEPEIVGALQEELASVTTVRADISRSWSRTPQPAVAPGPTPRPWHSGHVESVRRLPIAGAPMMTVPTAQVEATMREHPVVSDDDAIVAYAIAHPLHTPKEIAEALATEAFGGLALSHETVGRVLVGHGISRHAMRVAAGGLETLDRVGPLTRRALAAIRATERRRASMFVRGEPGDELFITSVFVAKLKDIGSIWQFACCDGASGFAIAQTVSEKKTQQQAVGFLRDRVIPAYAEAGIIPGTVITDRSPEFGKLFSAELEARDIDHHRVPGRSPELDETVTRLHGTIMHDHFSASTERAAVSAAEVDARLQEYVRRYNFERTHYGPRHQGIIPAELFYEDPWLCESIRASAAPRAAAAVRHYRAGEHR